MLLLIVRGVVCASLAVLAVLGQALLTRQLYQSQNESLGLIPASQSSSEWEERAAVPTRRRWRAYLALAILLCAPIAVWTSVSRQLVIHPTVQVTAHRGHARAAPENTLSAIHAAIHSGADFAEIDVQLTSDGEVVVLHDRDLKRVAGDARRIDELTLADLQQLDVGRWFGPSFVGERAPLLAEVIDLSRGRIRLNIEMKVNGSDEELARKVGQIIGEKRFEEDCIVTSFNHNALLEIRRMNSGIRTGVIIAAAVGDVTRLEGEVLSIRADWLTESILRQAHRRGQEVHVWTVNDERQMSRLMLRGVDNILTSDPDLLIHVRSKWANLSDTDSLILASRLFLGLDPVSQPGIEVEVGDTSPSK